MLFRYSGNIEIGGYNRAWLARSHHPSAEDISLDGVLYALSDPTRRAIVTKLLVTFGMNCGQVCEGLPPSTISHHHRILRESGLIRSEKRGVEVINSVRRDDLDRRFPGLLDVILNQPET